MKQRENNPLPPKLKGNHPSGQTHLKWCIFVLCLFLGVTVQAQKRISLTFQNETLVNVLKKVGDASGYKINFNTEDVQGFTVTATIQNKTATEALDIILKEKPFKYEEAGEFILIRRYVQQTTVRPAKQERLITGYIWDEQNVPIPGVSVRIKEEMAKGKMTGNITNVDGEYVMPLYTDKKTTLVFSFVGMETLELTIPAGTEDVKRNVILKEDQTKLDEVVVTGIFNKPRESYTGAATSFTRKELEAAGNQNLVILVQKVSLQINLAWEMIHFAHPATFIVEYGIIKTILPTQDLDGFGILGMDYKDNGKAVAQRTHVLNQLVPIIQLELALGTVRGVHIGQNLVLLVQKVIANGIPVVNLRRQGFRNLDFTPHPCLPGAVGLILAGKKR